MNTKTTTTIGKTIALSSCKGGVGKSTIAAGTALNLAARGYKVGLLDTDIFGPSFPALFGLDKIEISGSPMGRILPYEYMTNLKILSFAYLMDSSGPAILRGPMVSNLIQSVLTETDWGDIDYLVIDMPPGTGDIPLTICQTVSVDAAVIVSTPHKLSVSDVKKGIEMFQKLSIEPLGFVENMSYFTCPSCEEKHFVFGESATPLEEVFSLPILGKFPLHFLYGGTAASYFNSPEFMHLAEELVRLVPCEGPRQDS
jgi:ATP-binding protein involved in chromosome partitioning